MLNGRTPIQCHARPVVIVGIRPLGCRLLYLLDIAKQIRTEQLIAYRPVKALDIRVLLRIARLNVSKPDAQSLAQV